MFDRKTLLLKAKLVAASVIYRRNKRDIPATVWRNTLRKAMRGLTDTGIEEFYHVTKAEMDADIRLLSDTLKPSDDPMDPVLIIVVKDDLVRMKLVYAHYHRLGVHRFCILDNGSTDGTLEYVSAQPDTRVYQVATPYINVRKEGWVQYALDCLGCDRWYIVVDSDELLDYPGSETHPVQELIRKQTALGNERLNGYMVDMYAAAPLYSVNCEPKDIPKIYCYFDTESYTLGRVLYGRPLPKGGARQRMTGISCWAGKCPVFCYRKDTVNISAHFQYPFADLTDTNFCTVLRHYKFLGSDKAVYQKRAEQSSGYGATAQEYAAANEFAQKTGGTFLYEASRRYETSASLLQLPMLYDTFAHAINPAKLTDEEKEG